MDIKDYVVGLIQKKYNIDESVNIDTLNYVEEGYIDSLGIIQFIAEIEDKFNIEFSDEEIMTNEFRIVGELIRLIERKVKNNV